MTKLLLFGNYAFRSSCWLDRAERTRALIASDVEEDMRDGKAVFALEKPTQRLTRLLSIETQTMPTVAIDELARKRR